MIDLATNAAATVAQQGLANPHGIAVNPTTNNIYVTNARRAGAVQATLANRIICQGAQTESESEDLRRNLRERS